MIRAFDIMKRKLKSISVNPSFIHWTKFSLLGTQDYLFHVVLHLYCFFFYAIHSDASLQISSNFRSRVLILQFQQSRPAFIARQSHLHFILTCYLYIRVSLNALYNVVIFILHFEHTARGWLVSSIDYYY